MDNFFYNMNQKLKEVLDAPKSEHKQLNEGAVAEASTGDYSAKKARAGKDIGKPGKAFGQIAKSAGERYGSKERGEKVAGAVLAKLRGKNESVEEGMFDSLKQGMAKAGKAVGKALVGPSDQELASQLQDRMYPDLKKVGKAAMKTPARPKSMASEEYGPMESEGGVPMTPKQKKFAKLAPPADKITFADKIAGAKKEVDEMLGDVAAEAMRGAVRGKRQVADEGWDDMIKAVDKRHGQMKKGEKIAGHKGEIEKTEKGIKHTRRYDDKTGETDTGDDDKPTGEKRKGRPKGSGKKMGAKGPSGKSKLMTKEAGEPGAWAPAKIKQITDELADLRAIAQQVQTGQAQYPQGYASRLESILNFAMQIIDHLQGQSAAAAPAAAPAAAQPAAPVREEELDEKAVSQQQQKFMGMVHAMQKGEKVKGASPELKKVAKTMKKSDAEDFAKTKHKGLPKKKTEEVEETAEEKPKAGKGGMSFGKGIYDSINRELEQMIAESMNISMNMSDGNDGGPSKSLTVTATDEEAEYLGKLLKMAGMGGDEGGCGCGQTPCACNSAEQVDENQPDWPTEPEQSDDALQYAGGLNKPKTTVAGDGQTTVPVTAVQVRESEEEEELDEQEQVMAPESAEELDESKCNECGMYESKCKCSESVEESLARFRSLAGIKEAAKPDYVDLDKDGNKKESMKNAAADAEKDKKVEESILSMTNLWKAYKG